ncbi:MAG: class I SAM-dependent methyltransferase [Armatimonadetes bacterium]|nr:class I SAM-dependent methyltransferase [Armatimonadota bacterium]
MDYDTSSHPCPICGEGNPDSFRIWFDGYIKLFRCLSCGFVSQFPGPGASTIVTCYDDVYSRDSLKDGTEFYYSNRQPVFEDIVERIAGMQPSGKLLDIGCADGHFLSVARKRGYDCTGIDESIALTDYAAGIIQGRIVQGAYDKESFPQNSFDVVTLLQVIEHIPVPKTALDTAYYHLRPGGLLVVECPSIRSPHFLAYRATGLKWFVKPPDGVIHCHSGYYSPATLEKLAIECGFQTRAMVTGRWKCKYRGALKLIGAMLDPFFNASRIGGILYFGAKPVDVGVAHSGCFDGGGNLPDPTNET